MSNLKLCNVCDKWKFKQDFAIHSKNKDGLHYDCKKCKNKKARDLYQKRKKLNTNKKIKAIAEKEVKECSCCKHYKFLADFKIDRKTLTGYGSYCKSCHNKKHNEYHYKNKESRLEYQRDRYKNNIDRELQRGKEYRANNKKKEYIRCLKGRTLRVAKHTLENIKTVSDRKLISQIKVVDKYHKLFIDNSEKYKIIRNIITALFLESEYRKLNIDYNWGKNREHK